jgi:hypothetical protein
MAMTNSSRKLVWFTGMVLAWTPGSMLRAQEVTPGTIEPKTAAPNANEKRNDERSLPSVVSTPSHSRGYIESCPCNGTTWLKRCKQWLQGCFLGYPEEFEALPLGTSVHAFGQAQVVQAEAALMTLYQYDFVPGTNQLTSRGRDQVKKISEHLARSFYPLFIERSPQAPELDAGRAVAVLTELDRAGFAIPPQRIIIGTPIAFGLEGTQAVIHYTNLLGQTQAGGAKSGGGSSGGFAGSSGLGSGGQSGSPGK